MIAKILSSSRTFNAVEYNERKDEKGQSELLVAKNFTGFGDNPSKEAFKQYFKDYAFTNTKVKNPQFHATISTRGKEHGFDQLAKVGEQWMEKMGYGNQPYIIYGHSDTKNNHVHIVSIRIDEKGKKISDSFERLKSQKALNEILGLDFSQQADKDLKKLSAYNFSTMAQFKLMFERAGWTVTEKDGQVNLIKGGETQKTIPVNRINELISRNKTERKNESKKQLVAMLYKYKGSGDYNQVAEIMKSKFGVDMVFHTKDGHDKPYGYTVIDHKNRTVYKGSELMNLKVLLEPNERDNQVRTAREIIRDFTHQDNIQNNPNYTLEELKEILDKYGYSIDAEGNVKAGEEQLFKMGFDFSRLKYNTMLREALKFRVTNAQEARMVSSLFQVRAEHLNIDPNRKEDVADYYKNLAKAYATNGRLDESLSDQIHVYKNNNMYFVVDFQANEVYGISDSKLNYRIEHSAAAYSTVTVGRGENAVMEVAKAVMNGVFGMLAADGGGGGGSDKRRKRKRKY